MEGSNQSSFRVTKYVDNFIFDLLFVEYSFFFSRHWNWSKLMSLERHGLPSDLLFTSFTFNQEEKNKNTIRISMFGGGGTGTNERTTVRIVQKMSRTSSSSPIDIPLELVSRLADFVVYPVFRNSISSCCEWKKMQFEKFLHFPTSRVQFSISSLFVLIFK